MIIISELADALEKELDLHNQISKAVLTQQLSELGQVRLLASVRFISSNNSPLKMIFFLESLVAS